MRPFNTLQSLVVPIDRTNVDTDALIPKRGAEAVSRPGFRDQQ